MLLPMWCSKFLGVPLLVSHDKGKLPPSLRSCRPRQPADLRTNVVLLSASGDMWLPIFLAVRVVVTGVILLSRQWMKAWSLL